MQSFVTVSQGQPVMQPILISGIGSTNKVMSTWLKGISGTNYIDDVIDRQYSIAYMGICDATYSDQWHRKHQQSDVHMTEGDIWNKLHRWCHW